MKEQSLLKNKIKLLGLILWVIFAFSPCTVKEGLFFQGNIPFSKPINKTKATHAASSCSFFTEISEQTSSGFSKHYTPKLRSFSSIENLKNNLQKLPAYSFIQHRNHFYLPKYILFKRLKVALA